MTTFVPFKLPELNVLKQAHENEMSSQEPRTSGLNQVANAACMHINACNSATNELDTYGELS